MEVTWEAGRFRLHCQIHQLENPDSLEPNSNSPGKSSQEGKNGSLSMNNSISLLRKPQAYVASPVILGGWGEGRVLTAAADETASS